MWHPFDKRSNISALLIDLEFNTTFTVHPLSNIISVRKHLPSWWKQKVNLTNERNSPLKTHFRRSFMSTCSCDKSSKNSATLEWNKTNHEMKVKCYLQIKWCYKHEINTAAPPTWLDVSPFSLPLWTLPILLFPWALKSRERTSTSHCTGALTPISMQIGLTRAMSDIGFDMNRQCLCCGRLREINKINEIFNLDAFTESCISNSTETLKLTIENYGYLILLLISIKVNYRHPDDNWITDNCCKLLI